MLKLTPEIWAWLVQMNREVNAYNGYTSDAEKYDQLEFWTDIELVGEGEGDCEDYAIAKRRRARSKFPDNKKAFLLAKCTTENGKGHAVLVVVTDQGDYVMDNITHDVDIPAYEDLPYTKWSREEYDKFMWGKMI